MGQTSTRKKLILILNALIGPLLIVLALWVPRSWTASDDSGLGGALTILLVVATFYSLVFQLWLAKLYWEPKIARSFDHVGRRP